LPHFKQFEAATPAKFPRLPLPHVAVAFATLQQKIVERQ